MGKTDEMQQKNMEMPMLSTEAAARILSNVFEACGMPQNTIPLAELEEKYKSMTEGVKG